MNKIILSLFAGYLLGSISPSYILGKILRGIDLRNYGTGNLGTTNTKQVLGWGPAIVVAIWDLAKGVLAVLIGLWLGLPQVWAFCAGLCAIIGHIFPFYLKFKGGQGVATAVGLIFYFIFLVFKNQHFYHLGNLLYSLAVLAILSLALLYIGRKGEVIGFFVLPLLLVFVFLNIPPTLSMLFLSILIGFIFLIQIINIKKLKILALNEQIRPKIFYWRTFLRPLALVFVIIYFLISKKSLLCLIGILALIFILIDLIRLVHSGVNLFLFKNVAGFLRDKEKKKFSSMTYFLVALFIVIMVFPKDIAQLSILFLIFGDLAAKFFGLKFGRKKFFSKTLEGSIAYFTFALLSGFILTFFISFPFWILVLGSLTAAVVEALSLFGIDDNFTVGLISATVMYAFQFFIA